jgi:hypothetical protein
MTRFFELREKKGRGSKTIKTADSLEDLAEFLEEKTGRGNDLDPRPRRGEK